MMRSGSRGSRSVPTWGWPDLNDPNRRTFDPLKGVGCSTPLAATGVARETS